MNTINSLTINEKFTYYSFWLWMSVQMLGGWIAHWHAVFALPFIISMVFTAFKGNVSFVIQALATKRTVIIFLIWHTVSTLTLTLVSYFSLDFNIYDTGSHAHVTNSFFLGLGFQHFIMGYHAFINHVTPNLALFWPFYFIKPTFLWLIFAKLASYYMAAFFIIKISNYRLKSSPYRYLPVLLWTILLAINSALIWEFQPSLLAIGFIFAAYYSYLKKRYFLFWVLMIFTLGFKENLAFILLAMGCFIAFEHKDFKQGIALFSVGLAAGLVNQFTIVPFFAEGMPKHHTRLAPFAYPFNKLYFMAKQLMMQGGLALMSPLSALSMFFSSATSLISNRPSMFAFRHHYGALPSIFVLLTFTSALVKMNTQGKVYTWITKRFSKEKINFLVAIIFLFVLFTNHYLPSQRVWKRWPKNNEAKVTKILWNFENFVPYKKGKKHTIWASSQIAAYLTYYPYLKLIKDNDPLPEKPGDYILLHSRGAYLARTNTIKNWQDKYEQLHQAGKAEKTDLGYDLVLYRLISD